MENLYMINIGPANYFVMCTDDELATWLNMTIAMDVGIKVSAMQIALSDFDSVNHDQFC